MTLLNKEDLKKCIKNNIPESHTERSKNILMEIYLKQNMHA